jgi:putative resolvase
MLLADWARQQGIHPQTAYRWFRNGTLPVPATRVGPRTILVQPLLTTGPGLGAGLYARVSSPDQRADLDRQLARLTTWATGQGLRIVRSEREVGSGLNGRRAKIRGLLADPAVAVIVVEHRDRLGRMNTELVEATLAAHGRRLRVVEDREIDDDLVPDMTAVLTAFCARLYGRQSARTRAARALRSAAAGPSE